MQKDIHLSELHARTHTLPSVSACKFTHTHAHPHANTYTHTYKKERFGGVWAKKRNICFFVQAIGLFRLEKRMKDRVKDKEKYKERERERERERLNRDLMRTQ